MFCTVYRKTHHGTPLSTQEVRRRAATGMLHLYARVMRGGMNQILLATLNSAEQEYVIPCLDRAVLVKIEKGGLLLTGEELIPRGSSMKRIVSDRFPQSWWCVPRLER